MAPGGTPACRKHFGLHRGLSWQSQQENVAPNRTFKGDFNSIYHQNCLWYVLTLSYLFKMLSSSISTHCNRSFKTSLFDIFFICLWACSFFISMWWGELSPPGIPKGMLLQSFLVWDLSVVFHLCPWITISLWLQEPRLFPASDSLSYLSLLSHCSPKTTNTLKIPPPQYFSS